MSFFLPVSDKNVIPKILRLKHERDLVWPGVYLLSSEQRVTDSHFYPQKCNNTTEASFSKLDKVVLHFWQQVFCILLLMKLGHNDNFLHFECNVFAFCKNCTPRLCSLEKPSSVVFLSLIL